MEGITNTLSKLANASVSYFNYVNKSQNSSITSDEFKYLKISNASLLLFVWYENIYIKKYNKNIPNLNNILIKPLSHIAKKNKTFWQIETEVFSTSIELIEYLINHLIKGNYQIDKQTLIIENIAIPLKKFFDFIKAFAKASQYFQEDDSFNYFCIPIFKIPKNDSKIDGLSTLNFVADNLLVLQYTAYPLNNINPKDYKLRLNVVLNSLKKEINEAFINKKGLNYFAIVKKYKTILNNSGIIFNCSVISSKIAKFKKEIVAYYLNHETQFAKLSFDEQLEDISTKFIKFIKTNFNRDLLLDMLIENFSLLEDLERKEYPNLTSPEKDYYKFISSFLTMFNLYVGISGIQKDFSLASLYNQDTFDYSQLSLKTISDLNDDYFAQLKYLNVQLIEIKNKLERINAEITKLEESYNNYLKVNRHESLFNLYEVISNMQNKILKLYEQRRELTDMQNYSQNFINHKLKMYIGNKQFLDKIFRAFFQGQYKIENYQEPHKIIIKFFSEDSLLITLSLSDMYFILNSQNLMQLQNYFNLSPSENKRKLVNS